MKRIIILAALAILSQACVIHTDKDEQEDPRQQSFQHMQYNLLRPIYMALELSDFFDRYQDIRKDREASVALGKEYYGDRFYEDLLLYENYSGGECGTIFLTDVPGHYTVFPNTVFTNDEELKYNVEALGNRKYRISANTTKTRFAPPPIQTAESSVTIECTAEIGDDNVAVIGRLEIEYEELSGDQVTRAKISSGSDFLKIRFCLGEPQHYLPYSGSLDIKLSGKLTNDEFSVRYTENQYNIL